MKFKKSNRRVCIFTLVVFLALASYGFAATLMWDPNTEAVDGYRLYYGTSSTSLTNSIDVGNTTQYTIDSLPLTERTEYYFSVSAYNSTGESPLCQPVTYTVPDQTPPMPPTNITVD